MNDMLLALGRWQLDIKAVRVRMYGAPTPRERERWHAIWLLARGWSAVQVAEALERDAHTIGAWVAEFHAQGPAGLAFEQSGGSPPPSTRRNRPN
jgi:transposase